MLPNRSVKWMTTTDVCDYFNVHQTTLNKWLREGKIKPAPIKCGRENFFYPEVIYSFVPKEEAA